MVLLVTWDESYFQRLWCTYEISAFKHASPEGRIKVLPVALGEFVFAYTCGVALADFASISIAMLELWRWPGCQQDQWSLLCVSALTHFPCYVIVSRSIIRYM